MRGGYTELVPLRRLFIKFWNRSAAAASRNEGEEGKRDPALLKQIRYYSSGSWVAWEAAPRKSCAKQSNIFLASSPSLSSGEEEGDWLVVAPARSSLGLVAAERRVADFTTLKETAFADLFQKRVRFLFCKHRYHRTVHSIMVRGGAAVVLVLGGPPLS